MKNIFQKVFQNAFTGLSGGGGGGDGPEQTADTVNFYAMDGRVVDGEEFVSTIAFYVVED